MVELFDAETETSETPDMVREPEEQPDPEVHDFDDEKGLHPGHDLWTGVNNLMICNLPARCCPEPCLCVTRSSRSRQQHESQESVCSYV